MRADRPSTTASLVAAVRALYTALPEPYRIAPDPFAAALVPLPLAIPAHVAALAPAAAPLVHQLGGAIALGLTHHVALRTRAIDDALNTAFAEQGATQLVILGAGLDCRGARLDALAEARVFEVDHPSTHRYKAERLARSRLPSRARAITRVAIDFERDRLEDTLRAAGFEPRERSFWIWEGVTVYLTPAAIEQTLRAASALSAPGSRLAVTYVRPGRRRAPAWLDPLTRALGRAVGEPLRGMLETSALDQLLAQTGYRRASDESAIDWAARYWPGERPADEWERLAIAERV